MDITGILKIILMSLVGIGFAGLLLKRNLVMKIISMDIMNTGVISLFVLAGWREKKGPITPDLASPFPSADPVPQAVILTAIVIGFSILALLVVYVMDLSRYFHTLDTERIQRKWNR